jgi:hypothetical protein
MKAQLSVAISTADGEVYRWGPDEWDAKNIPQGIGFGTSMPGGFKSATITLPRRIDLEYPDLNLLDTVQILGPGNEVAWEGRVQQLPRSHGDTFSIQVGAVGWSAHLMDDSSFREIYIDRDITKWGEGSTKRKTEVLAFYQTRSAGISVGFQDQDVVWGPSIVIQISFKEGHPLGEQWYYGGGVDIGHLRYDFNNVAGGLEGTHNIARLYTLDYGAAADNHADHGNASATNQTLDAAGAGRKYALLQTFYEGPYTGEGIDKKAWTRPIIIGRHGLTERGVFPNIGFYASDVIANAVSRAAPLLKFTTGTNGSIRPTTFAIPHLVFSDPTTAMAVIMAANGYHLWDWGVWEDKEFFFNEPDPSSLTWEARLSEGARLDLEGTQVDDVYNGVFVNYTDPGGKTHTVGPPGSGADVTDASLVDTSETNPVNAHGIPKKWALLNISQTTTSAAAIQLGRIYLGEKSLPQRRGVLTLTGTATHPTAGKRPAWAVRAGHWVRISDHPTDVPRKIIETNYDAAAQTITCTLDNTSQKVDAILERLGVSLMGVI